MPQGDPEHMLRPEVDADYLKVSELRVSFVVSVVGRRPSGRTPLTGRRRRTQQLHPQERSFVERVMIDA